MKRHVSHSELQTWHTCKRQWLWGQHYRYRPGPPKSYFALGKTVHAALQARYESMMAGQPLPDLLETATSLASLYDCHTLEHAEAALLAYPTDEVIQRWERVIEPVSVEQIMMVPIPGTGMDLKFALDLVVYVGPRLIIVDFKTTSGEPEIVPAMDPQASLYLWAISQYQPVDQFTFLFLRKNPKRRDAQLIWMVETFRSVNELYGIGYRLTRDALAVREAREFLFDVGGDPIIDSLWWRFDAQPGKHCGHCEYQGLCKMVEMGQLDAARSVTDGWRREPDAGPTLGDTPRIGDDPSAGDRRERNALPQDPRPSRMHHPSRQSDPQ